MVNTRRKTAGAGKASNQSGTVNAAGSAPATAGVTSPAPARRRSSRTRRAPSRFMSEEPVQPSNALKTEPADDHPSADDNAEDTPATPAAPPKRTYEKRNIPRGEVLLRRMGFFGGGGQETAQDIAGAGTGKAYNAVNKERAKAIKDFLGEQRAKVFNDSRTYGAPVKGVFQDPRLYPNDFVNDPNDNRPPLRRFQVVIDSEAEDDAMDIDNAEDDAMDIDNAEETNAALEEKQDEPTHGFKQLRRRRRRVDSPNQDQHELADEDEPPRCRRRADLPNQDQLNLAVDPLLQAEPYPEFPPAAADPMQPEHNVRPYVLQLLHVKGEIPPQRTASAEWSEQHSERYAIDPENTPPTWEGDPDWAGFDWTKVGQGL